MKKVHWVLGQTSKIKQLVFRFNSKPEYQHWILEVLENQLHKSENMTGIRLEAEGLDWLHFVSYRVLLSPCP